MGGNDNEWVYLDSDDEKASPKAASAMPVTAAPCDATDVVTAADGECSGGAVGERGCNNWYADGTDEEDACFDDEDNYSDYSNEGRLERAYDSDEEEELDQVHEEKATTKVASATPMPLPLPSSCWTWDGATEVAVAADTAWSGGARAVPVSSYVDKKTDNEDACSDDEDCSCSDCSDTPCSGEAVGERGCKCWYKESDDEKIDQVDDEKTDQGDDETEHAVSDMKKLLGKLLDDEPDHHAAFDFDVRKLLHKLLDVDFDCSAFDFDMRKMLDRLRCIADRRKATRDKVYRGGIQGGYSDYRCGLGGGGGYGVTSNYYRGPGGDHGGMSDHDHYGGLSDFDYGSGRDDGVLSDFDYGSGRGHHGGRSDLHNGRGSGYHGGFSDFHNGRPSGYYGSGSGRGYSGGLSDFNYGSRRGYYGGISDYDYGRNRYRGNWYPGGVHPRTCDVPANTQYPPFKVPTEAEMLGSWI